MPDAMLRYGVFIMRMVCLQRRGIVSEASRYDIARWKAVWKTDAQFLMSITMVCGMSYWIMSVLLPSVTLYSGAGVAGCGSKQAVGVATDAISVEL